MTDEDKPLVGQNEKEIMRLAVRPEAIRIRKDEFFQNARSQFPKESLESLEKSIADLGLLKQIAVERDPANKNEFILLAGERRKISIASLKEKNIKVRDEFGVMRPAREVYEYVEIKLLAPANDIERLSIMLAENGEHNQVSDWDYFNFALWLDSQKNPDGSDKYDRKAMGEIFNRCPAWISHTLQIAKLPERAKACLKSGSLSRTAAVDLLSAKKEHYEDVLKWCETLIIEKAKEELVTASKDEQSAEIEIECADLEKQHAEGVADRIQAMVQQRRGTGARRKLTGALHRKEKAVKTLESPVITEETVKQVLDEHPEVVKVGVAAKTRSPKRIKAQLNEIEAMLTTKEDHVLHPETGQTYPKRDVRIVVATYRQMLGQSPLCIFALLDAANNAVSVAG